MRLRLLLAVAAIFAPLPVFAQDGDRPKAPADKADAVDKEVREILETFRGQNTYSSDEPRVARIIALGRAAVPPLMKYLREQRVREVHASGFHQEAARDALAGLAQEKDFADLAELLADGVLEASRALVGLRNPKMIEALLVPIGKGIVDWQYVEDLQRLGTRPEVRKALVVWLDKFGRSGDWECAAVARAVGELGVVEAVPVMKEIVESGKCDSYPRVEMAKALAGMGEKAGVVALLEEFDPDPDERARNHHNRHQAGEALNRVVGERYFVGRHGPGEDEGNFEEALEKFRAWWKKAEPTLRWDAKKLKWVW